MNLSAAPIQRRMLRDPERSTRERFIAECGDVGRLDDWDIFGLKPALRRLRSKFVLKNWRDRRGWP